MPIPSVYATGAAVSSTGAILTPAIPPGTDANDCTLLIHESDPALSASPLGAVTGYADVTGSPVVQSTASLPTRLTVRWHRATGPESGTISVPAMTNHHIARLVGVRGCVIGGNPWNVVASQADNATVVTITFLGLTTTATDCLILNIVSVGTDVATGQLSAWTNAGLANPSMAEVTDDFTLSGTGGGIACGAGGKAAAGAVAASTATGPASVRATMTIAMQGTFTPPQFLQRSPRPMEQAQLVGPTATPAMSSQIVQGG